jgi:hypothetical protein
MKPLCLFILSTAICGMSQIARAECGFSAEECKNPEVTAAAETPAPEAEGHSFLHKLLFYIPNRVLDVFDIVRLRVRVGPGVAVGVRATKVAQAYVGTYASVYAGLPGPRRRPLPKLPVGLESYNGVAVSLAEATASGGIGPDYSPTEFGISVHPLIFGLDIGLDPLEVVDFAAGILFVDIEDDDL